MRKRFADRVEAGRALAEKLKDHAGRHDTMVLALPRGGVPVGFEVARAIAAPLDLFLVRKLGAPGHEELAMGAIACGGTVVINEEVIEALHVSDKDLQAVIASEQQELDRRAVLYRDGRPAPLVRGKTVILVDDGLATGSTMRAAVLALRRLDPARIVVAVPVGTPDTCEEVGTLADACICAIAPENLGAVGLWYDDFTQTTDEEVRSILNRANGSLTGTAKE
jgi:putative phosphoribosyl transferase